ncbi:MAG TPA: glycosyltransferase [Steroidobacter sp.]|nr:glycosyltransferase [Steroidobacter sp.]
MSDDIVIIGLAITSSWGNGHATTYRSLVKGLHQRRRRVLFLEQDQPWYARHRDAPESPYCETQLYRDLADLRLRFARRIAAADVVIVGSYVCDGREVCDLVLEQARGVRAFYDIDTPVTLSRLAADQCGYLRADQVPGFDIILSFAGGPAIERLQGEFGARRAAPLYCSVDLDAYRPKVMRRSVDLGYMGTYSSDRQPALEALLNEAARRLPSRSFMVVGAQYPEPLDWPRNVRRVQHLPPAQHADFYNRQRFTLNVTRAEMRRCGYSPSVRLFEAAACGAPLISDEWPGLHEVFAPGVEILTAGGAQDVIDVLTQLSEHERLSIAAAARERVLETHSSVQRAAELESRIEDVKSCCSPRRAYARRTPEARCALS